MKTHQFTCMHCGFTFSSKDKRRKYCTSTCAAQYNNKNRENWPDGWRSKISDGLKKYFIENPEKRNRGKKHSERVGTYTKGKYHGNTIKSILDVSKRTISKILKRLDIGCCICGWKEASCDIHHINGRKIENADDNMRVSQSS